MRRWVVSLGGLRPMILTMLTALGSSAGCGPAEAEAAGSSHEAIVDGLPSGPEEDCVVLVQTKEPSGSTINNCSGTVVAPNLLLTARHCVSEYEDGAFTCSAEGELEHGEGQAGVMGDLVPPENIKVRAGAVPDPTEVARGKRIFALATPSICRNDIALVLLDRSTDLPVALLRLTTATRHGELMRAVGYGSDEQDVALKRKAKDDVAVTVLGPSEYWPEAGLAPPRTFAIGVSACQGDSGGPAFTKNDAVAGVYSLSAGLCTSPSVRNYYTQVAPFEDLVREAFEAAGAEPLVEAHQGAAGAGAADARAAGAAPYGAGAGGAAGRSDASFDAGTAGAAPNYHGPRKKGGCRCEIAGAGSQQLELALLAAVGGSCFWSRRRRRSRRRDQNQPPQRTPPGSTASPTVGVELRRSAGGAGASDVDRVR
ncbi:MAG: trypsin-like serine protease [Polyangiaceae bacterium]|nr:trypsin-like serine protease [Polyangiaceae bacterium]